MPEQQQKHNQQTFLPKHYTWHGSVTSMRPPIACRSINSHTPRFLPTGIAVSITLKKKTIVHTEDCAMRQLFKPILMEYATNNIITYFTNGNYAKQMKRANTATLRLRPYRTLLNDDESEPLHKTKLDPRAAPPLLHQRLDDDGGVWNRRLLRHVRFLLEPSQIYSAFMT